MATIKHKRGDTFTLTCQAFTDTGNTTPRDLSSVTLLSTMEHMETGTRFALTTTKTDATTGNFSISATYPNAAAWELGLWKTDVQFTESSVRNSTDTFYINVIEDVT